MKKKILLLAPVVLLALGASAFLYLRAAFPPERLLELLEPRVEAALGRPVAIGRATLKPFPLAVRLDDVEVAAASDASEPLLQLQALSFELQWLPLLRREIAVRTLVVDAPHVVVERNAAGHWNHVDSTAAHRPPNATAAASETPLGLRIESLRLRDGMFELRDAVADVSLRVPLAAELELQTDRALRDVVVRGWLEANGVSGAEQGRLSALHDLRVRIEPRVRANLADSSAVVEALRVEVQGLALELEGRASLEDGTADVHLRTRSEEFELAEILSLIPAALVPEIENLQARGTGKLSLQVDRDAGDAPRVVGRLSLNQGAIEHPDWPAPIAGLQAEIDWAEEILMISKLEARVADAPVRVGGEIHQPLDPEAATYNLNVQVALDLAKLGPMLPTPEGVVLEGQVGASVQARGALKAGAIPQLSGPLTLQDVRVQTPQLAQPVTVNASLLAAGDVVRIDNGSLQAGEDRIVLEGSIQPVLPPELPVVKLRGSTTRLDLDALLVPTAARRAAQTPLAGTEPKRKLLPDLPAARYELALRADELVAQRATLVGARAVLRGDDERFEMTWHGLRLVRETMTLHRVESKLAGHGDGARGSLRAAESVLGTLHVESLQSDVTVEGTRIELPNLTGQAYSGKVEGRVVIDVTDPEAPSQEIDVRVEEVQLGNLLGDLWSAGRILAGSVSGSTQMMLEGSNPEAIRRTLKAEGHGIAVNGSLRDMPMLVQLSDWLQLPSLKRFDYRELGFDFAIESGRARFPRLQVQSQDATLGVLGSIGLDGSMDLDLSLQLSEAATRTVLRGPLAGRIGSLFTDEQGHLVLDFDVRGSFSEPQLLPNFERTGARRGIEAVGKDHLRRLLGDLSGNAPIQSPNEDTLGNQLENAVETGVKEAIGGLFKKKKKNTAPADSTRKP